MIDGVEGCGEVEEEKNGDRTRVGGEEEIVCDFKEGCFCAMVWAETGLKCFEKLAGVKMMLELSDDCTFQDF